DAVLRDALDVGEGGAEPADDRVIADARDDDVVDVHPADVALEARARAEEGSIRARGDLAQPLVQDRLEDRLDDPVADSLDAVERLGPELLDDLDGRASELGVRDDREARLLVGRDRVVDPLAPPPGPLQLAD